MRGITWRLIMASAWAAASAANGAFPAAHAAPPPQAVPNASTAAALGDAFASIVEQTKGSVVSVLSEKVIKSRGDANPFHDDPFFEQFFGKRGGEGKQGRSRNIPIAGLGSGFILDNQGHVLTNDHVVEGMEKIHVVLPDKQILMASVLGSDAKSDIAVLQLKGDYPKNLVPARLGDSDTLKAGHFVLAFGAPFGLTQTVTSGIISATGRSDVGIADFEDFVQTDAPINPGNSGGPLVNMRGEVIAINTAIATNIGQSAGVGFAIPINMAKEILPTLLKGKKVVRGMLGIGVQDVTPSLEKQFHLNDTRGALVSQVGSGSPGEKAGLQAGDVIVRFAGKPIADSSQLREQVSRNAPGKEQKIELLRNGKRMTVTARLGELGAKPTETASASNEAPEGTALEKFGIEPRDLTPEIRSELDIKEKKGVLVADVAPGSPAGMAGIQPGDVITEIDRKQVDSVEKADQAVRKAKESDELLLLVDHKGSQLFVTLSVG